MRNPFVGVGFTGFIMALLLMSASFGNVQAVDECDTSGMDFCTWNALNPLEQYDVIYITACVFFLLQICCHESDSAGVFISQAMKNTTNPDCDGLTALAFNYEKCIVALPGCCERTNSLLKHRQFYEKCPKLEDVEAKCDGTDDLSALPLPRATPEEKTWKLQKSAAATTAANLQPLVYAAIAFGAVLFI
jgi:hypothetical protein